CPISHQDAEEMVAELKAHPILEGARGRKPVDKKALVSTLLSVSRLLEAENPKEFDLNPLMASEKGCVAVDMRLIK
ncbi:MAG: acetate--CoA ligase family protein, partial [Candidatus Micrarchaeota archaeon]|nr:acetate--CoA ligase family protein [Candidatus Micrarchaeota archaeon]